jgi:CDP-diacylglycerol--serine O-phosphatidyltransferase
MNEETIPLAGRMRTWVRSRAAEHGWAIEREPFLARLDTADWVSMGALFFGWSSALLILSGEPNWGVLSMLIAFGFDKLDGAVARHCGLTSELGLRIDSYIDVFAYLVPAAALLYTDVVANSLLSTVLGFLVLVFGGLRLVRHAGEGFGDDDGTAYYTGITIVHANVVVVANYFAVALLPWWSAWLVALTVLPTCPLMISNYRSYKSDGAHLLAGTIALIAAGLALVLEFGSP